MSEGLTQPESIAASAVSVLTATATSDQKDVCNYKSGTVDKVKLLEKLAALKKATAQTNAPERQDRSHRPDQSQQTQQLGKRKRDEADHGHNRSDRWHRSWYENPGQRRKYPYVERCFRSRKVQAKGTPEDPIIGWFAFPDWANPDRFIYIDEENVKQQQAAHERIVRMACRRLRCGSARIRKEVHTVTMKGGMLFPDVAHITVEFGLDENRADWNAHLDVKFDVVGPKGMGGRKPARLRMANRTFHTPLEHTRNLIPTDLVDIENLHQKVLRVKDELNMGNSNFKPQSSVSFKPRLSQPVPHLNTAHRPLKPLIPTSFSPKSRFGSEAHTTPAPQPRHQQALPFKCLTPALKNVEDPPRNKLDDHDSHVAVPTGPREERGSNACLRPSRRVPTEQHRTRYLQYRGPVPRSTLSYDREASQHDTPAVRPRANFDAVDNLRC
ncbi:hypothetical protein BJ170DRAFT_729050 [Xylariales sp. AK1849]|nr:hypothetical protein BJ170DRAFT_729050 [Xylariales sp. AK1849]